MKYVYIASIIVLTLYLNAISIANPLKNAWSYYTHAPLAAQVLINLGSLFVVHQSHVLYNNVYHYTKGYTQLEQTFTAKGSSKTSEPLVNAITTLLKADCIALSIAFGMPFLIRFCAKSTVV